MTPYEIGRAVGHATAYVLIAVIVLYLVIKFTKDHWNK